MDNIGRNNGLKIQLTVPKVEERKESEEDKIAIAEGVAKANKSSLNVYLHEDTKIDNDSKIRYNSSELIVITKTKKLSSYVITITEKSPKKFRAVFVNRMQNYCLDCLENLIEANTLRNDNDKNIERRKECQHKALLKLKLLSYMAFLSVESGCILKKQYQQISLQIADCINLLVAWRKSDIKRGTH